MKIRSCAESFARIAGAGMLCLCGGCAESKTIARRYLETAAAQARAGHCDQAIGSYSLAVQASGSDENCRRQRVSDRDNSIEAWASCKAVLADSYSGLARCYHDTGRPSPAIEQKKNDAAACSELCAVATQANHAKLKRWCANAAQALATLAEWEKAAGP
jgi:hypothetical protein